MATAAASSNGSPMNRRFQVSDRFLAPRGRVHDLVQRAVVRVKRVADVVGVAFRPEQGGGLFAREAVHRLLAMRVDHRRHASGDRERRERAGAGHDGVRRVDVPEAQVDAARHELHTLGAPEPILLGCADHANRELPRCGEKALIDRGVRLAVGLERSVAAGPARVERREQDAAYLAPRGERRQVAERPADHANLAGALDAAQELRIADGVHQPDVDVIRRARTARRNTARD